ncbi:MAG: hypothetical protein R3B35_00955 [Gemmatimonadales bacterium]
MRTHLLMLAIILTASPARVAGQRLWLDPAPDRSLGVVAAIGVFDEGGADFPSGTVAFRGRVPAGRNLVATVEFPMARAARSLEFPFGPTRDESAVAIGNPWIGFEGTTGSGLRLEAGIRPALWSPDTGEGALPWGVGALVDFDRWEAWFIRTSSIRFAVQLGEVPAEGPFITARLGGTGVVPRGGGSGEIFADYAVRLGVVSPRLLASVGVIGHGVVTSGSGSFGDRTLHQGELRVALAGTGLRPEVALRRFVGEPGLDGLQAVLLLGLTLAQ